MPLSLVILEGLTTATSQPILATRDPQIIAVVRQLLLDRLADQPTSKILPFEDAGKRPRREVGRKNEHD